MRPPTFINVVTPMPTGFCFNETGSYKNLSLTVKNSLANKLK